VELGIRSFVVVPVTRPEQQVLGLVELVSKDAHAFELQQRSQFYDIAEEIVGSLCPARAAEPALESGLQR